MKKTIGVAPFKLSREFRDLLKTRVREISDPEVRKRLSAMDWEGLAKATEKKILRHWRDHRIDDGEISLKIGEIEFVFPRCGTWDIRWGDHDDRSIEFDSDVENDP